MASRRDQLRMTDQEVSDFLTEEKTMICATNGLSGWPHLMPLWFVVRDTGPEGASEIWAWTFAKSQKTKNLERDARASLQIEAGEEYQVLRGVMFETEVVIHREVDDVLSLGMEIFARYTPGLEEGLSDEVQEMIRGQAAKRVAFQFVEQRRVSWDHRKLGGVY
ncbi:MAG: pyridoxamine 5'-phosphate oxidase family protein [Actinomycetes bacterium]